MYTTCACGNDQEYQAHAPWQKFPTTQSQKITGTPQIIGAPQQAKGGQFANPTLWFVEVAHALLTSLSYESIQTVSYFKEVPPKNVF